MAISHVLAYDNDSEVARAAAHRMNGQRARAEIRDLQPSQLEGGVLVNSLLVLCGSAAPPTPSQPSPSGGTTPPSTVAAAPAVSSFFPQGSPFRHSRAELRDQLRAHMMQWVAKCASICLPQATKAVLRLYVLSRADVARMNHGMLSLPAQGRVIDLRFFNSCVSLSFFTYAYSRTTHYYTIYSTTQVHWCI